MEIKKNPRKDVYCLQPMLFNLGLLISTTLVLMAFEWRSYNEKIDLDSAYFATRENFEPPLSVIEPPKPRPKPVLPKPVEVKNDDPIEIDPEDLFDMPALVDIEVPDLPEIDDESVDKAPLIADWVEKMPKPEGGYEQFYDYLHKNIQYPSRARNLGVEGKVFVEFVVDQEGNITNIKIARGIGAGCDEEVIRLMKIAPRWSPGKQRGKPVKVRMILPIKFQLSK